MPMTDFGRSVIIFALVCIASLAGPALCANYRGTLHSSENYGEITVELVHFADAETSHGYDEFCFYVTNLSQSKQHRVTIELPESSYMSGDSINKLARTVVVAPASTARMEIFQPPLGINGNNVKIFIDGRQQKSHLKYHNFNHTAGLSSYGSRYVMSGVSSYGSFHVLLSNNVSYDVFQKGKDKAYPSPSSFSAGIGSGFHRAQVPVQRWSGNWLSFSRFDGVVMTGADFTNAPPDTRSALRKYVRSGGALMVTGNWQPPDEWAPQRGAFEESMQYYYCGFGMCTNLSDTTVLESWTDVQWKRLYDKLWNSTYKHRTDTIANNNERFPVVEGLGVPIRSLFALVIVFAVVMGPVNIYVLGRKRKRIWMLWTVPAFALTAGVIILLFSFVSEGWRGSMRTTTVTILDQGNHEASTVGIIAYYCPLTPAQGLHFDYSAELTPMSRSSFGSGKVCSVDWTNDQHLASGWVNARVPAHFTIRKTQTRRERVKFTSEGEKTEALNGLGADISKLFYRDRRGRCYQVENIPAGQKRQLRAEPQQGEPGRTSLWRDTYDSYWRTIAERIETGPYRYLRRGMYAAVLDQQPFIRKGISNIKSEKHRTIVIGLLEGPDDES